MGAGAGLVLALALVAAGSMLPRAASSPPSLAGATAGSTTTLVSGVSSSARPQGAAGLSAVSRSAAPPPAQAQSTTATETASESSTAGTGAALSSGSLLAALPGESGETVLTTVSPLLAGLLIAALFYWAYARRQDSS